MTILPSPQVVIPSSSFRVEVEQLSGQKVSACFQCEKCTSGCPVTFAMNILPHRLIRSVHMGLKDEVLGSNTIWVCASCEACTTRCPNSIDIAHIMDILRQMTQREGRKVSQYTVPAFHSAFLSSIRRHGRVAETEMALTYYMKTEGLAGLIKQAGMGIDMFVKGKIKPIPGRIRAIGQVKNLFKKSEERGQL